MYLCYLDESGDPGPTDSPTPTFTVAAVLVKDRDWPELFDDMIEFRRYLRREFGLRQREEVKATDLVRGSGPWTPLGLGDRVRQRIYRGFMRLQPKTEAIKTFAVVEDKANHLDAASVFETTWRYAFERIETFARKNDDVVSLIPDQSGSYHAVRKLARRMRRHNYVGSMMGTAPMERPLARILVDDPFPRKSHESYFIQLADLNAYAAYRRMVPTPEFPETMWDELGDAILWQANMYSGGPPGIVCHQKSASLITT